MSIALVVTRGFGNGTFNGTIKDAVTAGYSIGAIIVTPDRSFSVQATISPVGVSRLSTITSTGQSVLSAITDSFSVQSTISNKGKSVISTITSTGKSVEGDL